MKKVITLLSILLVFAATMSAQTATAVTKTFAPNQTYYEYSPTAAQYIGGVNGYDTLNFVILVNKNMAVNCNARVEVASRKGTTDTYGMTLAGKVFENGTYANIIAGSGKTASFELSDTILVSDGAAYNYRYYRVQVNDDNSPAATDSLTLSKIIFKVFER